MKTCPYCRASIEESARFCLYCMTSLDEKRPIASPSNRRVPFWGLGIGVLVLLGLGIAVFIMMRDGSSQEPLPSSETTVHNDAITTLSSGAIVPTSATATSTTTTTTTATATETYSYRLATREDVYIERTIAMPDDVLIITGIVTPSANGIYRVPNEIDGMRVVAIDRGAFRGEDVHKVVLPANVMTVNIDAFSACPNLTDIYYTSNAIYTYADAFAPLSERTGTLTIHCASDCANRHFQYYRTIASQWFDAEYEEWNGEDVS